jgi:beta-lactamase class A
MLDILGHQHYTDLLPRFLPINPYAMELREASIIKVANKTGFLAGLRGDIAIISTPTKTLVISAFAMNSFDKSFSAESEPARTLGFLGKTLFDYFMALS